MRIHYILTLLFLSFTAIIAARVLFALFALQLGAGAFEVGLLAAANQVAMLAFAIPVGLMGDRFGARWLLVLGALSGAAGLLLPFLFPGMPALFGASALGGVWSALVLVLVQSLTGTLSTPRTLARNFSNFGMTVSLTLFAGPLIAGYAIERLGHGPACLALIPFAALALLLLLGWGGILPRGERHARARGALSDILAEPWFWRMTWMNSMVQLSLDLFPFYLPIYGHGLGLSASAIGWILAASSIAAFVVRFPLPRLVAWAGEMRVLAWSLGIAGLAFALTPLASTVLPLAAVALLYGAGVGGGAPVTVMLMYKYSPKGRAGESMGLRMTGNAVVRIVGPTAFGALAAASGLFSVFLATGLLLGASALGILRQSKTVVERIGTKE